MEMRSRLLPFAFLYLALSSFVYSQSDSCSSSISLNGAIQFETTSLLCEPVWNSQDFILRYLQTSPNLWSFVLSAPNTNSYIGFGFSTNGKMVGSSAMVGWIRPNGVGELKQYFLGGQTPGQVLPGQGNLPIVNTSTAIVSQSSRLYIAFQLNTPQPETRLIFSVGPQNRIPSSNDVLAEHQYHVATSLDYASGQLTTTSQHTGLRKAHGILNMLGWGIILLVGVIAARYLKDYDPIWFYSHTTFQSIGYILGVSGIIAGFVLENRLGVDVDKHKTLGVFILILGSLQVIALLARPGKMSKTRKYWNWYHKSVGVVTIILAIANVFYGIHLGGEGSGWNAGYGVTLAILVLGAVGLEVRMRMRK